jgi:hypothetical protein
MSLCCGAPLYMSEVVAMSRAIGVRSDRDVRRGTPGACQLRRSNEGK